MYKPVTIRTDAQEGIVNISSRPAAFAILLFAAGLIGLFSLPFTEYRDDYLAYAGLLFLVGLTAYYAVISSQSTTFANNTRISVRKGFRSWQIPFSKITGGYTSYEATVSRQSLAKTHYLNVELEVDLPDDPARWIRNGKANIFHYGFSQWGAEEEKIRAAFDAILAEKGIAHSAN